MTPNDLGTCEWLVGELVRARLLERGQLDPILADFREQQPYSDAEALAQYLTDQQLLTPFQANRALQGDARKLVLGPYVLVDSIGTGNMGTVYRAIGRADRLAYAVKVLPLRSLWNVRLARRQVRAFAELPPHPTVVPFIDVGTAIGVHYLVWPCVEGITLERAVKEQGTLPFTEVARIGLQIAEGLQNCHPRGLFHGLLKPSNVMIGIDKQVRLLDFGIGALLAENMDEEESLIDTISTANATSDMLDCSSPEAIVDPTKRTPAGDQYSLGCTLYYAVTGHYPFPDGNVVEKMMAHQHATPKALRSIRPDIPSGLVGVIERLMSKAPQARYPNLEDLIDLLTPLSRGNSSGVIPRSSTQTPRKTAPVAPAAASPQAAPVATAPVAPVAAAPARPAPARPTAPASTVAPARAASPSAPRPQAQPPQPVAQSGSTLHPASLHPDDVRMSDSSDVNLTPEKPQRSSGRAGGLVDAADDFDSAPLPAMTPPRTPPASARIPKSAVQPSAAQPASAPRSPTPQPKSNPAPVPPKSAPTTPTSRSNAMAPPADATRVSPMALSGQQPAMPIPSTPTPLMVNLPEPPQLSFMEKLLKTLMFWTPIQDTVQLTLFSLGRIRRGESLLIQAIVHPPEMTARICEYAQNVQPNTQVLGATYFSRRIVRGKGIQLYLEVQSGMIDFALQPLVWNGQPGELKFTLQLDPRAVGNQVQGALSVGQDNILIGQIPLQFAVG